MVRFVIKVANEPARRFRLLWNLVGIGIVGVYLWIGSGYAVAGQGATSSKTLHLVQNIEPGGYRTHGVIMMLLAVLLAHGLGPNYRRITRLALQFVTFHAIATTTLIIGGWSLYEVEWAAPAWYALIAFLSLSMLILAPPLNDDGTMYSGPVNEDGSERA